MNHYASKDETGTRLRGASSVGRFAKSSVASPKSGVMEYGFWTFLLIAIGRVGELIPGLSSLPTVKITLGITLLILFANWKQLPRVTAAGKGLLRTALWLIGIAVVLTPFSIWRGASIAFMYQDLPVLVAGTVFAHSMSRNWRNVRGTLFVLVLCGAILAGTALLDYGGGRAAVASMYDTNDLAYLLVTVFPLAIGFVLTSQTKQRRMVNIGIAAVILVAMLLTESRGAFLGLIAVVLLIVLMPISPSSTAPDKMRKRRNRVFLPLLGILCLGAVVWPQLPQDTRARFATLLNLGSDYNLDPHNDKSRGQIWTRGFDATLDRPVGYGPGAFGMVDLRYGGRMMAPHNSFVQMMVELGVIGLLLFLRMYILAWRGLGRLRKNMLRGEALSEDQKEQVVFIRLLQCALAANAVAGFFLSMAYATVLWVIFGVCLAFMTLIEPTSLVGQRIVSGTVAASQAGRALRRRGLTR